MKLDAARRHLKRAHINTLVCIGLATALLLAGVAWQARDDAYLPQLVNMAGKQRALARQIAFVTYQLKSAPRTNTAALQEELRQLATTFQHNHAVLTGKQPSDERATPLSNAIDDYYSSHLLSLDERSQRFALRAQQMGKLPVNALPDYPTPSAAEVEALYDRLDRAVVLFEQLIADKARDKNQWLLTGAILLILVYILCWSFLLRPARRHVGAAIDALCRENLALHQQELQNNSSAETRAHFLTTISHEFRGPISAIVGALELIPNMRARQDELIQQAEQACYRLLNLTNNLLDIMGNTAAPSPTRESFDLIALLDECIAPWSAPSRAKQLEFSMQCETTMPTFVTGYPDAITRVIKNVMDNAIKFTSDGFINVLVSCHVVNKRYQLTVKITDSGIGIKDEDQKKIFDRFYRVDAPGYQQYAGAGVGLTVAKKYAEACGGEIHLASQQSIGSEFTLTFPLNRSTHRASAPQVKPGVCFAVVDDLEISRLHVSNIIQQQGFTADCFSSGSEFLANNDRIPGYAAIIADFYMPGINGLELASTVSAMFGKRTPPVIMMSATPDIANIMANSEIGAWQAFVKPLDQHRLSDTLQQLANRAFRPLTPIPDARILIVEDEPINADIIRHMVHCMGHNSVVVHNGEDALQRLNTEVFDAVLLDINLPDVNGVELALIAREKGVRIPIIAVTANAFASEKEQTRQAGIRYHLVKPVTYQELKNTLRLTLSD
ncbi:response regulator [Alteromonas halophila]|uniref:histidine kinase n=1 Tax=Alteromonas halophila TaxID=516698 RepID=A0A918MX85_9ALTE|nr:response regulator [Alteromonas halophila]GGW80059.1 hypothetical protein GCM10007391_11120 [Alteromonas halophila]